MKTVEQKGDAEPMAAGYRPSQRAPAWRWDSPPTHAAASAQRWTPVGPPQPPSRTPKAMVPIPYREPQHIPTKRSVSGDGDVALSADIVTACVHVVHG